MIGSFLEIRVVEFINLRQGGMSVTKYSLKFTKFSKYDPFIFDPRDEMSRFVTRVSDELQEECHSYMLHENMNISHLMIHSQQVKEARSKRKSSDAKRGRSFDGGSSKDKLDIEDKHKFKKRFSSLFPTNFPKASDDRVSKPNPQKRGSISSPTRKPYYGRCGKKHYGDCLKETDNCFGCGKSGHKVRYCPNVKGQDNGGSQAQESGSNDAPKKNRFYALRCRGEQETSLDVVTGNVENIVY